MKVMSARRMWTTLAVVTVVIILLAAVVVLFITANLQQKLFSQTPNYDASTLYSRGVDQLNKGDYATAEASLEQALRQQNDDSYRGELAVVKYRLKKYQESIDLYQQLITSGKDAAFAWNGTGNAYRDWADADTAQMESLQAKAIDAYTKSIALNPQYVAAYSNLALLYESRGEREKALQILNQGIQITSSNDLVIIKSRVALK